MFGLISIKTVFSFQALISLKFNNVKKNWYQSLGPHERIW